MPFAPKKHSDSFKGRGKELYKQRVKDSPRMAYINKLRMSGNWKKVRKQILLNDPICYDPFKHHEEDGRVVVAQEVHHILPVMQRPDLIFVEDNLAGLCKVCHDKISSLEKKGKDAIVYFRAKIDSLHDNGF